MDPASPADLRLAPRKTLWLIGGFWSFFWLIGTIRSAAIEYMSLWVQIDGALRRAIVVSACMAMSWLLGRALARVPATSQLRAIRLAALLCLPAGLGYAAVDIAVFDYGWAHPQMTRAAPIQRPITAAAGSNGRDAVSVGQVAAPASNDEMKPWQSLVEMGANGYFFFAAWAALYLALNASVLVGALERRAALLQSAAQAAELRALRYQVNPHFLFNTLNALSGLVLEGRAGVAERMILNLSSFFRASLAGDPTIDVPLAEEMALQRLYLDIEMVRFPERLRVEMDVPEALGGVCVPGLILQPLVENAIKHAVANSRAPVTIRIAAGTVASGLRLTVADDGGGKPGAPPSPGTGLGLRNVRDRLAARYGGGASVRWGAQAGGGFRVDLDLPLVRHGC